MESDCVFEIGMMVWATEDVAEVERLGVRNIQLGIPGDFPLDRAGAWKHDGLRIYTVFAAFEGEDYADIPTVKRTVGFVPPSTREAREARMLAVIDFAASMGVRSVATHIGFVDEDYAAMRDLVRRICDHAASHGQTFALETGQESAETLKRFIIDVDRTSLGINFDPANMILYGTGDPMEALDVLAPYVLSVHAKDGDWPAAPDALGEEKALGAGSVGMERFVGKLREIGYNGPLAVEREASDPRQRLVEIRQGIDLLTAISHNIEAGKLHYDADGAPTNV